MAYEMCGITMAAGPAGISRDTGASFPLFNSSNGTVSSVAVAGLTTTSATTTIVVTVATGSFAGSTQSPISVAASGGTGTISIFTKRLEIATNGSHTVSIWTADATTALSGVTVTASGTSGSQCAWAAQVDALKGTAASYVGQPASAYADASTPTSITVNGVTAGSWIYVGTATEQAGTLTNQSGTSTTGQVIDSASIISAVGVNTSGGSGNVLVGWTTSATFTAVAALEIKAA
jgi:hypothetical protein